jgi:hypothetical protein
MRFLNGEAYSTRRKKWPCFYCGKPTNKSFDNRPEQFCGSQTCARLRELFGFMNAFQRRTDDLIANIKTFDRES